MADRELPPRPIRNVAQMLRFEIADGRVYIKPLLALETIEVGEVNFFDVSLVKVTGENTGFALARLGNVLYWEIEGDTMNVFEVGVEQLHSREILKMKLSKYRTIKYATELGERVKGRIAEVFA